MTVQVEALAPVSSALLARAGDEAGREVAEARRQGDDLLAQARGRARAILDEAADAGRSDAAVAIAAEHSHARRAARALELDAQKEIHDLLRREVAAVVARLVARPEVRARLVAAVRAALGPDAAVLDAPGGGVIGQVPGRLVDLSVPALADRAVEDHGGRAQELWEP
ncbi:MAG: hypothetical protein ABIQ18_25395 [Umezawaea sp.]